jgi:Flp pilus assembly pilin Flp
MSTPSLIARLVRDEGGQDLIEYVLLTAGFGIVTIATWPLIEVAIGNSYQQLDAQTQDLWEPPDPGAGS